MKCCNKPLKLNKGKESNKELFWLQCPTCDKKGKGSTQKEAEKNFNASVGKKPPSSKPSTNPAIISQNYQLQPVPKDRNLSKWSASNMGALLKQSAQFIDKPETRRMIEKNIRYVASLTGKAWDKVWSSAEGQESISYALSESLYYGATLPDMGSMVPFGSSAEFIPAVECFKHALQTGRGAPLKDIEILTIHKNDLRKTYRKDGNFAVDIEYGSPRGDLFQIAVLATKTDTNKIVGELYDVDYLMEKAEHHSQSYRYYIIEKEDFARMKSEGKLKKDSTGREYMEKNFPTWTKKIYEHDIKNPYGGPDRVQMLMKSAGKTFFRPYMKVRNAAAMAQEWEGDNGSEEDLETTADTVLSKAAGQFTDISEKEIKDAEIIPDDKDDNKKEEKKENEKPETEADDLEIEIEDGGVDDL